MSDHLASRLAHGLPLLMAAALLGAPLAAQAGRIIVCSDEIPLSDAGFAQAPPGHAAAFALDVAAHFTGGGPGAFLVYSTHAGLTGSALAATMTGAGHQWTVSTAPVAMGGLQAYHGVFLGGPNKPDDAVLIDYVLNGGNVYLAAGTGDFAFPASVYEMLNWSFFLGYFGLYLSGTYSFAIQGPVPLSGDHPLLASGLTLAFLGIQEVSGIPSASQIAAGGLFGIFDLAADARYQVNQPGSSLSAGLGLGGAYRPPPAAPGSGVLAGTSASRGLPWDVAITSPEPAVPAGAGGLTLPDGQIVNVDLTALSLTLAFGGAFSLPFSPFSVPFAFPPAAPSVTFQMVNLSAGAPLGIALSAPVAIDPQLPLPGPMPGPVGDDSVLSFSLSALGYPTATIPFCDTAYTQLFVSSNGFVSFGSGSTDPSPSAAELTAQMPRIGGFWTDLEPGIAGSITVVPSGSTITVSYAGIPSPGGYNCTAFGCTVFFTSSVDIVFDLAGGSCAIQNLAPGLNASGLVGLTPGNNATDPGPMNFSSFAGGPPQSNLATDAVYQPNVSAFSGFSSITFPTSSPAQWIVN